MLPPWIRSLLTRANRKHQCKPVRGAVSPARWTRRLRPRLDTLEDRTVPSAFRLGSTLNDTAHAVVTDSAGNVYVSGAFNGTVDFDPGAGTSNLTSTGNADGFIAKYSPAGGLLWVGQLVDSSALGLAIGPGDTLHVTGGFVGSTDFDLGAGTFNLTTGPSIAGYVAKYNPDRSLVWAQRLGGQTSSVIGRKITLDAAGNVYSSGSMSSGTADFDPGAGSFGLSNSGGNFEAYISKLNSSGNFVYAHKFSNDQPVAGNWINGLGVDANQNIYVSGSFIVRVDFDPAAGNQFVSTLDTTQGEDGFVVKLTAASPGIYNLGYVVRMGSATGQDIANDMAVDSAGNAYVTGQFNNTMTIDATAGDTTLASAGFSDIFVQKLSPTGALDWARRIGAGSFDSASGIVFDGTNGLYLTGSYANTVDFDPNGGTFDLTYAGGFVDSFALKLRTDSTFVKAWSLGGAGGPNDYDLSNDIAVTNTNMVQVVGRFTGTGDFDPGPGGSLTSAGGDDAFVSTFAANRPPVANPGTLTTDEDTAASGTLVGTDPDGDAVTYAIVSAPTKGTISGFNASTGAFTYTPNLNLNGADSFTFKVNDGEFDSNVATVSITINPVNDAPVADDQSFATDEDVVLQGQLVATDVDSSTLTFTRLTNATNGVVGVQPDGRFTYIPRFNFFGTDSFTFRVSDGTLTDDATVIITVRPVNDAPFFDNPTRFTSPEDQTLNASIPYLDVEGDEVTFFLLAGSGLGSSITLNGDGSFEYTPIADYNGFDAFSFRARDSQGAFRDGSVIIKVTPVNDAPVANNDHYLVNEDELLSLDIGRVSSLHMVSEPGDFVGGGLTWDYTTANATFSARQNFDNGVRVTVLPDDSFWFLEFAAPGAAPLTLQRYTDAMRFPFQDPDKPGLSVSGDGRGHNELSGEFTVRDIEYGPDDTVVSFAATFIQQGLNFDGTLDPPMTGTVQFNTKVGARGGVLANDTDVDGDKLLTAVLVAGPSNGTLTLNRDGTLSYTPNANFHGIDTFTYRTNDGLLDGNIATVTIEVIGVNDAPVAVDDSATTTENTPVTVAVLANDTDADGDTLTVTEVTQPANGTATINGDGTVTYTPRANFNGADSFTYTVSDGQGGTDTATVAINVRAVNNPPVANDGSFSTDEDTALDGTVTATDADGDPLTFILVTAPAHGSVTLNPNGSFTYTPAANYNGPDSFTFKANDGLADSNVATASITVNAVNDAPVANNGSFTTDEDTALNGNATATDVEGDALTYLLVAGPANGSVTLNGNGSFTYTPAANFNGSDSFTFKANDGSLDSNVATVSITVSAVNDRPDAVDDSATTDEDAAVTISVLVNDTDVDGNTLTVTAVTQPTHGSAAINANGTVTYTPASNYNGSDSFTYTISDGNGGTDTATVSLTVRSVNDAPVANNGSFTTDEDTPLSGNVTATDVDGDTLSFLLVAGPANGTVVLNGTGSFTYTPAANFNGSDSFTFKANDGTVDSNVATVTITVRTVNDAPVAVDDSATTDEDTATTISVLGNDTDVDGDTLTVSAVTQPAHGTAAINGNGTVTYTPASNYNGSDSFTYTISDGNGGTDTATVSLTVRSVNDAPVANNGSFTTDEDTPLSGSVTATDVDGDTLSFLLVAGPANGSVVLNGTGSFTYTPAANFNGSDSFTFKANDGTVDSNVATVSITIRAVNDAPVAVDDSAATDEDMAVNIAVLANDTDVDGDTLTVTAVTQPTNGTVVINGDGTVRYTPLANFHGTDSFTYTIGDGNGGTDTATVSLTVRSVNDAPVANNASFTTDEDTPLSGNVTATDVDGDTLSFLLVAGPANGSVVLNSTGSFTYTPAANFNGSDSFTFKANDGTVDSNVATVTITIRAVNDAPVAVNDSATTNEDSPVTINVLANDIDVDGDTLTPIQVAGPTNGTLVLNGDGTFRYTPNANFNGNDSFTYKVTDGTLESNVATVNITVGAVNDPPVAVDDSATTDEDTAVTIAVLANDTDADGDTLTPIRVAGPSNGTLVLNGDGTFAYTPNSNFNGTDTFTYKVTDGTAESNVATVTIRVNAVNDPPVAVDDSATTDEDTAVTIGVLANDSDVDGDTLTVTEVTQPANGTAVINGSGTVTYTPLSNFHGADSFTYTISDGRGGTDTATVSLNVLSVNDPPVANNASFTTDEDTPLSGNVTATDVDGDTLGFLLVAGPANGSVVLNGTGSFTYTPAANFNGSDSFTFKANDGTVDSNVATVTITIRAVNDAPVAVDDSATTDEDTAATIGVLANDTDVDGDTLTVSAITQPSHGTAVINGNGTVTYTPVANYNGSDSFTYTVSDGNGGTDTATVSLTVRSVNDAPVAANDTAATDEDTAVTIGVLANDTDVDGDALTPVIASGPAHGSVVVNSDGTITYTPHANYNGADSFTYRASDGALNSNVATVAITVRAVNDAPVAVNDSYTASQDGLLDVPAAGVLTNDTDVEGTALKALLVSGPANGVLVLDADGSFTYQPATGFVGTDSFTYKANDGLLDSNVATVTIQVNATTNTEGKVTGGGYVDRGVRRFNIDVQSKARRDRFVFSGQVRFRDLQNRIDLRSTAITGFRVDSTGQHAVITGNARVNGQAGYTFTITVSDLANPGRGFDKFRIEIAGPSGFSYDSLTYAISGGVLDGGNIKVRKRV